MGSVLVRRTGGGDVSTRTGRLLRAILGSAPRGTDARLRRRHVRRGETLVRAGEVLTRVHVVETGRFSARRGEIRLAEIGAGEVIGEISFLTGAPATADVIALRDSVVLEFDRALYDEICAESPAVAQAVAADLASRLAATNKRVIDDPDPAPVRTIVLVPAGDVPLPGDIGARLAAALSRYRRTELVDAAAYSSASGPDDPESEDAAAWFHARENAVERLVFLADPGDTAFSRAVIRQADHVILFGRSGSVPPLSSVERLALSLLAPEALSLALLHPARSPRVSGTAAWLDTRAVGRHHHLSLEDEADLMRLARYLAGQAIGLVCSGGGAHGVAHVGVFEALSEAGIVPDIVGGASVGSAMTGAFAIGRQPDEIMRLVDQIFVRAKAMKRLTVPRYGLLDHTVLDAALAEQFGEGDIEDLWLPYFAVAADLSTDSQRVIRRGPLWRAVRASSAIPGVLPAYYDAEGHMLVDGGVVDNMPFRVMHGLKTGPNVVVDVQKSRGGTFQVDYDGLPGRWRLLRQTVLPFLGRPPRAPGVISNVMRSLLVTQSESLKALRDTDLVITPPMPAGAGFLAWEQSAALFSSSLDFARARLAEAEATADPAFAALRAAAESGDASPRAEDMR